MLVDIVLSKEVLFHTCICVHTNIHEGTVGLDAPDDSLKLETDRHIFQVKSEKDCKLSDAHKKGSICHKEDLITLPRRRSVPLSSLIMG
jgi:hypothetical protein